LAQTAQAGSMIWNFKLLANNTLDGFGGIGEGMSMQLARDGRRILWLAHESAPKNFTAVDVSDPRNPKIVARADLPQAHMRSNSLETVGDVMAVAYQTQRPGLQPAGFELFDISTPENPKRISFTDLSGPHSRGVHQLWFADGETIHMSSGAPDFVPSHPKDDQFYMSFDVKNPSKPTEIGRWWLPGQAQGDNEAPPKRHPEGNDSGFRPHNTNVYPQRPDRVYMGYLDGGMIILDISDKAHPRMVSRWDYHPPNPGFTHTVVPFFSRDLLIVSDESTRNDGADWPKLVWVVDNRTEENPVPISTCPLPPVESFGKRGGRFGAHNLWENLPKEGCWNSEDVVFGTFFNGGLRAYDMSNPYQPKEVAHFVPQVPGAPTGACQLNDVFIDDRGIVYTVDRHVGGLYTLEMDF
jgi:hypothetical protein